MSLSARLLERRRSGVLLHPTSLMAGEGPGLCGGLGAAARAFVDWLAQARFSIWQVLPLGPSGEGGSPYWARSDFAGDASLIDRSELPDPHSLAHDYQAFRVRQGGWLEDYVLFETISDQLEAPWWDWPPPLREREPAALASFAESARDDLEERRVEQWQFDWQWRALRSYAAQRGVYLFGDLPIYVAPDSVATWSARTQFQLDASGRPTQVAGVPPDYFSADGQLWGNPLYDWDQAVRDNFAFWRTRLARALQRFDLIRIDHFRGLAAYWSVPAGARTAREGHWRPAPGHALFRALTAAIPNLPLVAEDLGVITPPVGRLRDSLGLPGMLVLQFGFDPQQPRNPHAAANHVEHRVVYVGTHDQDTARGWLQSLDREGRAAVQEELRRRGLHDPQRPWWSLVRLA
ncbi:MAG: 4-alpha-glucanotransferase, partial [Steroidobacteraceae bacterium]